MRFPESMTDTETCQLPADRVAEVKELILSAFPETVLPAAADLTLPKSYFRALDWESMKQSGERFAGKTWQSLTPEFLAKNWSSYCYLSRQGYRYYLPALLMRALHQEAGHNFQHSVVFSLVPSFWYLYFTSGRDRNFDEQTALFTDGQSKAVAAFLGLFFDSAPSAKFLSAQALRWGWNRVPSPELAKVTEYYKGLHNYDWPQAKEQEARALVEMIKTAFKDTPTPKREEMCNSKQGDEPSEYAMEFFGQDWRRLHPEFLDHNSASLSFLPAPAFRYFLPAYLIYDLTDPLASQADPAWHLSWIPGSEKGKPEMEVYMREKLSKFNKQERSAIAAYLEYKAAREPFEPVKIKDSIRLYWKAQAE